MPIPAPILPLSPVDKVRGPALETALTALGAIGSALRSVAIPFGAEISFKLVAGGRLMRDRLLVGVPLQFAEAGQLVDLAVRWGIPPAALAVIHSHIDRANAVLFGLEPRADGDVRKVYLEFWDTVRDSVRVTGTREPQLLHLGVKWQQDRQVCELAHYRVHPMLSTRDALRMVREIYGDKEEDAAAAVSIIRSAWNAAPRAAFLFESVSEEGNPRQSFDINLYPAGLRLVDVQKFLLAKAAHLDVNQAELSATIQELGALPLGHLSGGMDRTGREFLTIYAELAPMPGNESR